MASACLLNKSCFELFISVGSSGGIADHREKARRTVGVATALAFTGY